MVLELIFGGVQYQFNQLSKDVLVNLKVKSSPELLHEIINISDSVNDQIKILVDYPQEQFIFEFKKYLKPFSEQITRFSELILQTSGGDLTKAFYSDRELLNLAFKSIKENAKEIGVYSESIISILTKWMDYTAILIVNMVKDVNRVTLCLKEIDVEELTNNNYGTLLSLACVFRLLREGQVKHGNFKTILKLGIKYSDILESYADTIDIMCSPKEQELIKDIDDGHLSDNSR